MSIFPTFIENSIQDITDILSAELISVVIPAIGQTLASQSTIRKIEKFAPAFTPSSIGTCALTPALISNNTTTKNDFIIVFIIKSFVCN